MSDDIVELSAYELSAECFRREALRPNRPAVIRNAGELMLRNAQFNDLVQHPEQLVSIFGEAALCVTICSYGEDGLQQQSAEMTLDEIMQSWSSSKDDQIYLKDVHLQQLMEEKGYTGLYEVPDFLGGDWLSAFQLSRKKLLNDDLPRFGMGDDYRFLYAGPSNATWTPFHFDVFGSYSWSLNVRGTKTWYFAKMSECQKLYDEFPAHRPRPSDMRTARYADGTPVGTTRFLQKPGDLVFVPSCYFHQVHNGDDSVQPSGEQPLCISINHNWCNEYNIVRMCQLLADECRVAEQMVDDEVVAMMKADDTWGPTVESMLRGSGAWTVAAMEALLEFAESVNGSDACREALVQSRVILHNIRSQWQQPAF